VVAVAAGSSNAVALKKDGTVWAWGDNWNGQLAASATNDNYNYPVQAMVEVGKDEKGNPIFDIFSEVVAIAEGDRSTFALKSDGTVWAWGANWNGQLGDGTTVDRHSPKQISGFTGVVSISAGCRFTLALKNDGTVWAWGANWYGQLGDGTTTDRYSPVQVLDESGAGVVSISAGDGVSIAVKNDGAVWAWGTNSSGQVGDGTTTNRLAPVPIGMNLTNE
jgi:alpha-tubulin suppressor-like RCC1 family protein